MTVFFFFTSRHTPIKRHNKYELRTYTICIHKKPRVHSDGVRPRYTVTGRQWENGTRRRAVRRIAGRIPKKKTKIAIIAHNTFFYVPPSKGGPTDPLCWVTRVFTKHTCCPLLVRRVGWESPNMNEHKLLFLLLFPFPKRLESVIASWSCQHTIRPYEHVCVCVSAENAIVHPYKVHHTLITFVSYKPRLRRSRSMVFRRRQRVHSTAAILF